MKKVDAYLQKAKQYYEMGKAINTYGPSVWQAGVKTVSALGKAAFAAGKVIVEGAIVAIKAIAGAVVAAVQAIAAATVAAASAVASAIGWALTALAFLPW